MARAAETKFARSGDVDIAYQVFGEGERDIVMTMGWVTHLEVMWELPELAYFLERLGSMGRVIIFDKRGTGLSDRVPGMVTLEQRAEDVRAVMDAARSERAAFVGWADGGAIGAMFAATNPERISALAMSAMTFVTTSTGLGVDPATMQLMQDTVERGWGSGGELDFVAPLGAAGGDPERRGHAAAVGGGDRSAPGVPGPAGPGAVSRARGSGADRPGLRPGCGGAHATRQVCRGPRG